MVTIKHLVQFQLLSVSSDGERINQAVINDAEAAFAAFLSLFPTLNPLGTG